MSGSSRDVETAIGSSIRSTSPRLQKPLSCISCARRKIKCDRQVPCLNCIKSGAGCVAGARANYSQRRKTVHLGDETLVRRLNHYEKLLLRYGARKDELDEFDGGRLEEGLRCRSSMTPLYALDNAKITEGSSQVGRFHAENSSSRIWVPLSDEILEYSSEEDLPIDPTTRKHPSESESSLLLRPDVWKINLTHLHPYPVRIFQLWQKFVDNVNPLVKILHIPTVQKNILSASGDLACVPKQTEALMFSIYSLAVTSMTNVDCEKMMGEQRSTLLSRYHNAAKQALMAADWIKSSNFVTLQTFTLFLLSTRQSYDIQTLSILTGVGIRIAQRLGLHREKLLARQSAFDAEMGRRLWWQVGSLESKTADLAGVTNTANLHLWDTKLPANLNDSDLSPQMSELPPEYAGATEMAFCLVRHYVGEFQRTSPSLNGSWELLVRAEVSMEEKEKTIMELKAVLQEKVLQHLDRGIPLHLVTIGAASGFVDRLRLLCLHPRLYPDRCASLSQSDKDKIFDLCLSVVQRDNWCHTLEFVQEYLWHINSQFQSDAFIYLLHELRYQCTGKQADIAWPQILEAFEHHPEILHDTSNPLWVAIGNLTLKSWTARERAFAPQHQQIPPEGILPHPIMILRAQRIHPEKKTYTTGEQEIGLSPWKISTAHGINKPGFQVLEARCVFDSEDWVAPYFDANNPMDVVPVDWTYWNDLIQESELPVGGS